MEEIYKTLREQIKGNFDEDNIIVILDNSISLTCEEHPIPGTNNRIFIIQPYLIDSLEKIGKQLNIYEYFHRVQIYLDILIQVQWIKMSLNLKCYFIRQYIEEELELEDNLILLPNFPYINTYLEDYKYLIIYESPKYILL